MKTSFTALKHKRGAKGKMLNGMELAELRRKTTDLVEKRYKVVAEATCKTLVNKNLVAQAYDGKHAEQKYFQAEDHPLSVRDDGSDFGSIACLGS